MGSPTDRPSQDGALEDPSSADERRFDNRQALDGDVVVELAEPQIIGPGQNISPEGVFFVSEGAVRVRIRIEGEDEGWRAGELIRVQSMGPNQVGVAVKFTDSE